MAEAGNPAAFQWALLWHEFPPGHDRENHWDLLIQEGDALRAWALDRNPLEHDHCRATSLADHRLLYLDWSGPLSGNRGQVTRIARGQIQKCGSDPAGNLCWVLAIAAPRPGTMTITVKPVRTGETTSLHAGRS